SVSPPLASLDPPKGRVNDNTHSIRIARTSLATGTAWECTRDVTALWAALPLRFQYSTRR
ncbi:MAG: hypothetical protein ACK5N9_07665, partial [Pirellula sp.]